MNDAVNHPKHYTSHPSGVEAIEITQHYNFCIGNAIKYLWRNGLKDDEGSGAVKDLKKAIWYINREIENLEKGVYNGQAKNVAQDGGASEHRTRPEASGQKVQTEFCHYGQIPFSFSYQITDPSWSDYNATQYYSRGNEYHEYYNCK
jgi:hypothetical protein